MGPARFRCATLLLLYEFQRFLKSFCHIRILGFNKFSWKRGVDGLIGPRSLGAIAQVVEREVRG